MKMQGLYTALVTPFNNGNVDYDKIIELVDIQLEAGVDGIVPMGTTGESPTLTTTEHLKVIDTVIKRVNGRCQIIAGTGANSTFEAVHQTTEAKKMGADASLQVTPYYNKPTQEGLYRHFAKVADVGLPIVLYNVPGRSGIPIAIDTVKRLSSHPSVVAVKEAGGSVDRVSEILNCCDITVLSGDDALTLPMMSVGATGVISVASNLYPKPFTKMVHAALAGNWKEAKELHYKYYSFMKDIFIESNPAPIKAAMAKVGLINEEYRLPICSISDASKKVLFKTMDNI